MIGPLDTGDPIELFDPNRGSWTDEGREISRQAGRIIGPLVKEILEDYPDADLRHIHYILGQEVDQVMLGKILDHRMGIKK